MKPFIALALFPLAALAGPAVSQSNDITVRVGDQVQTFTVANQHITGPTVSLAFDDQGLRGRANGLTLNLDAANGRLRGIAGNHTVNLEIAEQADGFVVRGLFADRMDELTVTTGTLRGHVGRCGWDLALAGDHYAGTAACGRRPVPEPAALTLPASLANASSTQLAALLEIALSQ